MSETRRKIDASDPIWAWFEGAQPLSDIVPIELENGAVVDELSMGCRRCDVDARPEDTRGEIRNHTSTTYWLRIGGACRRCRTLNLNTLIVGPTENGGFSLCDISIETPDPFARRPSLNPITVDE